MVETLAASRRAGAGIIGTYDAREMARSLS